MTGYRSPSSTSPNDVENFYKSCKEIIVDNEKVVDFIIVVMDDNAYFKNGYPASRSAYGIQEKLFVDEHNMIDMLDENPTRGNKQPDSCYARYDPKKIQVSVYLMEPKFSDHKMIRIKVKEVQHKKGSSSANASTSADFNAATAYDETVRTASLGFSKPKNDKHNVATKRKKVKIKSKSRVSDSTDIEVSSGLGRNVSNIADRPSSVCTQYSTLGTSDSDGDSSRKRLCVDVNNPQGRNLAIMEVLNLSTLDELRGFASKCEYAIFQADKSTTKHTTQEIPQQTPQQTSQQTNMATNIPPRHGEISRRNVTDGHEMPVSDANESTSLQNRPAEPIKTPLVTRNSPTKNDEALEQNPISVVCTDPEAED